MNRLNKIGAGMMIGICADIYHHCENPLVGALLFGLGLTTVCACGLPLFTGRIGGVKKDQVSDMVSIFI